MTDTDFLLHVLRDGFWHGQHNIIDQSIRERGYGLTVNSRASDLRKLGYDVECHVQSRSGGRRVSFYRLKSSPRTGEQVAA